MDNFVHLHLHTQYSLLDGFCDLKKLAKKVKALGQTSVAITDHGAMYGAVDFYKACKNEGIKPIIGCEIYMAERTMHDKDSSLDRNNYHLVLLAMNDTGYKNLIKIVSLSFTEGFYYKPRADWEILEKYSEGLIALSACIAGKIPNKILNDDVEGAKRDLEHFISIYGKENFYLEIQDHGLSEERKINESLLKFSKEYGLGLVATNDTHYIEQRDSEFHDILLCIQTTATFDDEKRMRFPNDQFYLKSTQEMSELFSYAPEAIENTVKIAQRCNMEFEFHNYHLPHYDLPEGYTAFEYLHELCLEGLKLKYPDNYQDMLERLDYELGVINTMGFCDYFLIVWDFIKYAKDSGIPVGPGRGSAAGSIVSYCLNITEIDPIKYSLIFERFLNSERVSMPDIDIDICSVRRPEVIEYVVKKYGASNVSQIMTFGTLKAKAAVRDVGRTIGMSYAECDKVSKEIPNKPKTTIESAIKDSPDLAKMIEEDDRIAKLIDLSKEVEGCVRNAGIHAAGVVITDKPIMEYLPLALAKDGGRATQYTMTTVEELGLLKMDFLGLKNMTVIKDTVDNIELSTGKHIEVDQISLDDPNVFALISKGDTGGVFQLESGGMRSFMRDLRPDTFEDIIAGISLYRPGPMDFIPEYIKNKRSPGSVKYLHPALEPILGVTYGCMVYQEQVMQIVRDLAGFSMGQSDNVRRAMSKKKFDVMKAQREVFVNGSEEQGVVGCVANGISADIANKIFDQMESFAAYAFNKSHAAAYAVIAYKTAYLKNYYPKEFFAALLTNFMSNDSKLNSYMKDLSDHDIALKAPDINESYEKFTVAGDVVRFGLTAVKGMGENAVEEIITARKNKGKFIDFADFVDKLPFESLNKKGVENLIKSGAFDSLGHKRSELIGVYADYIEGTVKERKNSAAGQLSFMELAAQSNERIAPPIPKNMAELSDEEKLMYEKEALGLYISGHPVGRFDKDLEGIVTHDSISLNPPRDDEEDEELITEAAQEENEATVHDGDDVVMVGLITGVRQITTKKGQMMAFIQLEDKYGSFEAVIFPKVYEKNSSLLKKEKIVLIKGTASQKDGTIFSIAASCAYDPSVPGSFSSAKSVHTRHDKAEKRNDAKPKKQEYSQSGQPAKSFNTKPSYEKQQSPIPSEATKRLEKIPQNTNVVICFDESTAGMLSRIKSILDGTNGSVKVILYDKDTKKKYLSPKSMWVNENIEALKPIRSLIGYENVKLQSECER